MGGFYRFLGIWQVWGHLSARFLNKVRKHRKYNWGFWSLPYLIFYTPPMLPSSIGTCCQRYTFLARSNLWEPLFGSLCTHLKVVTQLSKESKPIDCWCVWFIAAFSAKKASMKNPSREGWEGPPKYPKALLSFAAVEPCRAFAFVSMLWLKCLLYICFWSSTVRLYPNCCESRLTNAMSFWVFTCSHQILPSRPAIACR